jgi:hypothetical protein
MLSPDDTVTVRFVLGKPAAQDEMFSVLLKWENDTYGDLHMIDMVENMNDGKSYEYFASMAQMFPGNVSREQRKWDYVMKVDDDSFLHLPHLVEKLRPLKREKVWFVRPRSPVPISLYSTLSSFSSSPLTLLAYTVRDAVTKANFTCSVRATSSPGT